MNARTPSEQAVRWFMRLQETGADAQTFMQWQHWLNASPAHRIAYDEVERAMQQLRIPVTPPLPSAEAMAQDEYDGSMSVEDWRRSNAVNHTRRRYALAASVLLAMGVSGFFFNTYYQERHGVFAYRTLAGERREFHLPDDSYITLDADSAVSIQLSPQHRTLRLERGEAYFQVAKDRQRPFSVTAGDTQVTAVGTAFNVRMAQDRTVVAVTEGRVAVRVQAATQSHAKTGRASAVSLDHSVAAGEAVAYKGSGQLAALSASEASLATSWLQGRRQYRNEALRYVLADVNRYTGRHFEIVDSKSSELQFTGTVDLDNIDAWLKALELALPVKVTESSKDSS